MLRTSLLNVGSVEIWIRYESTISALVQFTVTAEFAVGFEFAVESCGGTTGSGHSAGTDTVAELLSCWPQLLPTRTQKDVVAVRVGVSKVASVPRIPEEVSGAKPRYHW